MPAWAALLILLAFGALGGGLAFLVGNSPLPPKRRPTLLERARDQYVRGELDVEQFEDVVGKLLEAGIADSRERSLEYVPIQHLLTASQARRAAEEGILPIELEYLVPEPFRPAAPTFVER